jgi:hypothetical protein
MSAAPPRNTSSKINSSSSLAGVNSPIAKPPTITPVSTANVRIAGNTNLRPRRIGRRMPMKVANQHSMPTAEATATSSSPTQPLGLFWAYTHIHAPTTLAAASTSHVATLSARRTSRFGWGARKSRHTETQKASSAAPSVVFEITCSRKGTSSPWARNAPTGHAVIPASGPNTAQISA